MGVSDLTPVQRVQRESLAVISHAMFRPLGGIVMMGKTSISDEVASAATDGFNTEFNPEFIRDLTEKELRFLILHEALHKAKRDLVTWKHLWERNAELANQACDYVNNLELVKADPAGKFIQMPEGGCLDWRFDGMDVGEVFRLLEKEQQSGGGGSAKKPKGFDEHDWEGAAQLTPEQAQKAAEEVKVALRQGLVIAKTMAGDMERLIQGLLEPDVDWRAETREFALQACSGKELSTWRRPNRRSIGRGVYMPSSYSERVRRLVIGADTSGSISRTIISLWLGTVVDVARAVSPELVDLIYWDGKVQGHEKYDEGNYESILASTRPRGGGGTRPSCLSTYLRESNIQPECILILTDGIVGGDWGHGWTAPVLWCIAGRKHIVAANGKTLHIKEKQ